jgi:multiple sugar transport system substrate-binding protein
MHQGGLAMSGSFESGFSVVRVPADRTGSKRCSTRRALFGSGAALVPILAAACGAGGTGANASTGQTPPAAARKATVTWLFWGTQEFADLLVKTQDAFMRRHPTYTVDRQYIADSNQLLEKLIASVAGGTPPDMSSVSPAWLLTLGPKDLLRDVDPLLGAAKDVKRDDFLPWAFGFKYNGKNLAMPYKGTVQGMVWFNKTLLDGAGVPAPLHTWTWDQYVSAAKRLTKPGGAQWGVSTYPWDEAVRQNGGEIVDTGGTQSLLDRPEVVDAIQWVADLALVQQVAPRPGGPTGWEGTDPFLSGKVAFHSTGDWDLARYVTQAKEFPWQVTSLPHKTKRAQSGAPSYQALPKGSKEPEVGWELCKYFTLSMEAQKIMSDGGKLGVPPYKPHFDQLFLAEPYLAYKKEIAEAAKYNVARPSYPNAAEIDKLTADALKPVWAGEQSAKQAMSALVPVLNAALKRG